MLCCDHQLDCFAETIKSQKLQFMDKILVFRILVLSWALNIDFWTWITVKPWLFTVKGTSFYKPKPPWSANEICTSGDLDVKK